jgi:hypothetical protein
MTDLSNIKTILAIWNSADKGKTETLREIARLLLQKYPNQVPIFPVPSAIPQTGDFRLVVNLNGRIVAIESQGDPNTDLKNRLLDLADNFGAEVILCSTRTSGGTIEAVENLRLTRAFEIIWSSTYQADHNHALLNITKAAHIVDLLCTLNII